MVICTRRGCGVDFTSSTSSECKHHPGGPVFHEGLKSWSCCKDVNKPVLEFDQFLAIPGCLVAPEHSSEKQAVPTIKSGSVVTEKDTDASDVSLVSKDLSGKETFGQAAANVVQPLTGNSLMAAQNAAASNSVVTPPKQQDEEQDPPESIAAVPTGATCKRGGCSQTFQGGIRDRSSEECKYHKGSPIFHEGSKGWSCCKKRVLDFNDFLQLPQCTEAQHGHLFLGAPKQNANVSDGHELVDCRLDHYETPNDVRLTVYAKAVDQAKSSIEFQDGQVNFSLTLPPAPASSNPRRFQKTLRTFAPISPTDSSFNITKFKVDLILVKKARGQSWPCLEAGDMPMGYGLTFGRDKDK